jgi:hypothetical protein
VQFLTIQLELLQLIISLLQLADIIQPQMALLKVKVKHLHLKVSLMILIKVVDINQRVGQIEAITVAPEGEVIAEIIWEVVVIDQVDSMEGFLLALHLVPTIRIPAIEILEVVGLQANH